MNVPIFCRGDLTTCGASRFARKCMPITIRNGYAPYGIPTAAGRGRRHRRPENERLSPYVTATDCRYLCSFFPSGKKEPKKVLPSCAAATTSRGSMKPPTLLSLEMRYRLTRCTCISQNLAFAPRTEYRASNPRFQYGCVSVFLAVPHL